MSQLSSREINQEKGRVNKISIHEIIEFANLTSFFATRELKITDVKVMSSDSSVQSKCLSHKSSL